MGGCCPFVVLVQGGGAVRRTVLRCTGGQAAGAVRAGRGPGQHRAVSPASTRPTYAASLGLSLLRSSGDARGHVCRLDKEQEPFLSDSDKQNIAAARAVLLCMLKGPLPQLTRKEVAQRFAGALVLLARQEDAKNEAELEAALARHAGLKMGMEGRAQGRLQLTPVGLRLSCRTMHVLVFAGLAPALWWDPMDGG